MSLRRTESTIISWDSSMEMIQVFKIVQSVHDISMNELFEFSDTQTRSNSKKLKKPRALKTFRMNSFCVRTTNKWNSLPNYTVNSKSVLSFKTLYDRYKHNWRDLLANLLVSINIAYWISTVRLHVWQHNNCIFEKNHHLQKRIYFTKANRPLDWKSNNNNKTTAPPRPPPKNIVLCLQPRPPLPPDFFHLEKLSTIVFWCARIHVQFI